MKTDEKLSYFYELLTEKARKSSDEAIADQKKKLADEFEKYKKDKIAHRESILKDDMVDYQRKLNRTFSSEQIEIRRALAEKTDEITETVFAEVEEQVKAFRESPEYANYLCKKINEMKSSVDRDAEFLLSASDKAYTSKIASTCGVAVHADSHEFGGGFKVLCPKRNLLIDNSFETRLREEKDAFVIA